MKIVLTPEEVKNILMDWLIENNHAKKEDVDVVNFQRVGANELEIQIIMK